MENVDAESADIVHACTPRTPHADRAQDWEYYFFSHQLHNETTLLYRDR